MAKQKDPNEIEVLTQKLIDLRKIRAQIDSLVANLENTLAPRLDGATKIRHANEQPRQTGQASAYASATKPRPVRLELLDCLEDLDWMAYTREIAQYSSARTGREITPTRFGSLVKDEVHSYAATRATRPTWLCFGLTHDRFEPIKRLLGRSDWPLEKRIVAPTSGRIQHLKLTARLCELAIEKSESFADAEMLRIIAADHARDLPGIKFKRGEFDLERWRDVATEQLQELLPRDEELRREAAARFEKAPEQQQLFGKPEVIDLEPGISQETRA